MLERCVLPDLTLEFETLDGATNHPVVFRDCEVGRVNLDGADVRVGLRFEVCTVSGLSLKGATFESDLGVGVSTIAGPVDGVEARFGRDADFAETTFEAPVTLDEA